MLRISKKILTHQKFTQLWIMDTSCATRLGALSALAWVSNGPPDQEQSLTPSDFAHSGVYPLGHMLLTFDVMLSRP